MRFEAPQEQIECYQLGYRLIGRTQLMVDDDGMDGVHRGWHRIDPLAASRGSCHFTAGDLWGCTVAVFAKRQSAFRLSIPAHQSRDPQPGPAGGSHRFKYLIYLFLAHANM